MHNWFWVVKNSIKCPIVNFEFPGWDQDIEPIVFRLAIVKSTSLTRILLLFQKLHCNLFLYLNSSHKGHRSSIFRFLVFDKSSYRLFLFQGLTKRDFIKSSSIPVNKQTVLWFLSCSERGKRKCLKFFWLWYSATLGLLLYMLTPDCDWSSSREVSWGRVLFYEFSCETEAFFSVVIHEHGDFAHLIYS